MAHFKNTPVKVRVGKINYSKNIVENIVVLAVSELPYVKLYNNTSDNRNKYIKVNFGKDTLEIDVVIKIHYSQTVTDIAFIVQEAVRHNVEAMSNYSVSKVNVIVRGVFFDSLENRTEEDNLQDKQNGKTEEAVEQKNNSGISDDADASEKENK